MKLNDHIPGAVFERFAMRLLVVGFVLLAIALVLKMLGEKSYGLVGGGREC